MLSDILFWCFVFLLQVQWCPFDLICVCFCVFFDVNLAGGGVCQLRILYKSGRHAPLMLYHRPFEISLTTLYDIQEQGQSEYPTQVVVWNVTQLTQFLYKNFM